MRDSCQRIIILILFHKPIECRGNVHRYHMQKHCHEFKMALPECAISIITISVTNQSTCIGKYVKLRIINKTRCKEQVYIPKSWVFLCQFAYVTSRTLVCVLVLFKHTSKMPGNFTSCGYRNLPASYGRIILGKKCVTHFTILIFPDFARRQQVSARKSICKHPLTR